MVLAGLAGLAREPREDMRGQRSVDQLHWIANDSKWLTTDKQDIPQSNVEKVNPSSAYLLLACARVTVSTRANDKRLCILWTLPDVFDSKGCVGECHLGLG